MSLNYEVKIKRQGDLTMGIFKLRKVKTTPTTNPSTNPPIDPPTDPPTNPPTDPESWPETNPETWPETDPETWPATDPEPDCTSVVLTGPDGTAPCPDTTPDTDPAPDTVPHTPPETPPWFHPETVPYPIEELRLRVQRIESALEAFDEAYHQIFK